MRATLLLAVFCGAALAGTANARQRQEAPPLLGAPPSSQDSPVEPTDDGRIRSTSEANRDGITGAMSAPLRDVNIVRTKIPRVLLEAMDDPYQRPARADCASLISLVQPLDVALGEDIDRNPPTENEDLMDRGRKAAGGAALGAVASAAQDMIPMRGWVRKLSGAERHDRLVQSAVASGAVRRAYLKGLGEARGCNPPATPQHKPPAAPVVVDPGMPPPRDPYGPRKPRFPIVKEEAPTVPQGPRD
ncbi:hypothetical protein [Caulobacter sp. FWC2]|uniref:hypothetical protein n=1 Tax=Caulobacter sp. FWC2 TaxID=69664 RepID=UPI000C147073|nr:hypothetical protein [Caulobacter sp. FWC2]PIB91758.1 hypothetical protein CSW62_09335 [Caulobacter sp. FWC2]